ncbi:glycosyltransferase, partial [Clostridium chrysemydis]|uniref:glycosyltransferase n=1 Tax=Clostridium chrysemydis TaxID=2665504 RepID=UPI003F33ECEB
MNILHYTLGLPPYRSGGLTKYSIDLMKEQVKDNEVYLLFPGKNTKNKRFNLKYHKEYYGIKVYEEINTLPVPLLGGVNQIEKFTRNIDSASQEFRDLFEKIKPDIIHIHTLMGLPKELIRVAKEMNIKTVFTTHDYYGICAKVNLTDCDGDLKKCKNCNTNAYSMKMINIMQSSLYRNLKESTIVKVIRRNTKKKVALKEPDLILEDESGIKEYKKFREFYVNIMENIDYIHFNSSIAKSVYDKHCNLEGEIMGITHSSLRDYRSHKSFNLDKLKLVFLGPVDSYKGFPLLLKVLSDIDNSKWSLDIYGNTYECDIEEGLEINFHGRYNHSDLKDILAEYDVLVVPSICKETFGFTALEGLSYGIPIIINENVGASNL